MVGMAILPSDFLARVPSKSIGLKGTPSPTALRSPSLQIERGKNSSWFWVWIYFPCPLGGEADHKAVGEGVTIECYP